MLSTDNTLLTVLGAFPYSALGMHDEGVARLQTLVRLSDRLPLYVGMLGQACAWAGRQVDAETLLQELGQRSEGEYVPPMTLSWIAMALGDADRAFEWLEQEYRERTIVGSPATFAARLREYGDAGVSNVELKPLYPSLDNFVWQLETLQSEVVPALEG